MKKRLLFNPGGNVGIVDPALASREKVRPSLIGLKGYLLKLLPKVSGIRTQKMKTSLAILIFYPGMKQVPILILPSKMLLILKIKGLQRSKPHKRLQDSGKNQLLRHMKRSIRYLKMLQQSRSLDPLVFKPLKLWRPLYSNDYLLLFISRS
jgi:hypothetical protein